MLYPVFQFYFFVICSSRTLHFCLNFTALILESNLSLLAMASTKRNRQTVQAPADDDWNAHKEHLQNLYFNSTLSKLMDLMKKEFGFIAS